SPLRAGLVSSLLRRDRLVQELVRVHGAEHVVPLLRGGLSPRAVARPLAVASQTRLLISGRAAVLAPGYGGTARQPILRALADALATYAIASRAVTFATRGSRPSAGYESELADLRVARDALGAEGNDRVALVGRSFGGRIA